MNQPISGSAAAAIEKAKARLEAIKKEQKQKQEVALKQLAASMQEMHVPTLQNKGWYIDDSVPWNAEQQAAINAGLSGKSFCLIGAAGTGKTTTLKGVINSLMRNNLVPIIPLDRSTKYLRGGTPGIVLCSFTNMAVRQIAKHFSNDVTCVTIHKLLEYAPVRYTVEDELGNEVNKMVFEPSRHSGNPLPRELRTIVVDESSMVDSLLFDKLIDALPNPSQVQFVFLGDLNQLPPVYGGPILGRKLLELPIIELTQVYRQALLSPIIRFAIEMKDGKSIPVSKHLVEDNGEHGKVTIHPWSKPIGAEDALVKMQGFMKAAIRDKYFDIMQDMALCPFNVNFGTVELNRAIADYLGRERGATVYEVIAGFNTHYYAVGDKVLASKQEAFIVRITKNSRYTGKRPINPDLYEIDRYGGAKKRGQQLSNSEVYDLENDFDVDALLESMVTTEVEDRVHAASHKITLLAKDHFMRALAEGKSFDEMAEESTWTLESAGEVNEMLFGYVITVHKSQGSEWRRVFFLLHQSHAQMCSRELMYTGMTRAREELYMVVEPDRGMKAGTLSSSAKKPRLKGNTLAEKLVSLREKFEKEAKEAQDKKRREEDDTN